MSFSTDVKAELCKIMKYRHCKIAEFGAIINYSAKLNYDKLQLTLHTENTLFLYKIMTLLEEIFNITINENIILYKNKVVIQSEEDIIKIFNTIKVSLNNYKIYNKVLVSGICCKRAYIRGAFICSGYISQPTKNYHMEFINTTQIQAKNLKDIINSFEIESKIIEKKSNFVVYIKEGEQIADLLNIMECHKSLLAFENIRIVKEIRNKINRAVNCETANLSKIVSASVKQKQDIEYIKNTIGFNALSKELREIALLRLDNLDVSLQELSNMTAIPISKSGINHRLKKLNSIARGLRGN